MMRSSALTANPMQRSTPSPRSPRPPISPGVRAAVSAIRSMVWRASEVGVCRRREASGPRIAPIAPATSPQIVTGTTSGAARRFAGNATNGILPKTGSNTGATPIWAAAVTARESRIGRGPGIMRERGAANNAIPAVAPAERRNPTECRRSGSSSNRAMAAMQSTRTPPIGLPRVSPARTITAIVIARRTDGSQRVAAPSSRTA